MVFFSHDLVQVFFYPLTLWKLLFNFRCKHVSDLRAISLSFCATFMIGPIYKILLCVRTSQFIATKVGL
jgi:hypothetical protein